MVKTRSVRGNLFSLYYRVILVVNYRCKLIDIDLANLIEDVFAGVVKDLKCWISNFEWDTEHVAFILETKPADSVIEIIRKLKRLSSHEVLKTHPEIRGDLKCGSFWSPNFYVVTVGESVSDNETFFIRQQAGVPK